MAEGVAHARVRRALQNRAERAPTVRVEDANRDPVAGARVRLYVGDWRGDTINKNTEANDIDATVAYLQNVEISATTDADGVVTFPDINDWGLDVPGTLQGEGYVRKRPGVEQYPDPVDPRATFPRVQLIATLSDDEGTDWFGARTVKYSRLIGVDGTPPFPNDGADTTPPVIVLDKKRLEHRRLDTAGREAGGDVTGGPYGGLTAWHAVAHPGRDGPRGQHQLFVEAYAAKPAEAFTAPYSDPPGEFYTVDAFDQATALQPAFEEDLGSEVAPGRENEQRNLLLKGALGIDVNEDHVEVLASSDSDATRGSPTRKPLVTNPQAVGPHTLGLATAFRFIEEDEQTPLYALLPGAFHTNARAEVEQSVQGISFFSIVRGLIGLRSDTFSLLSAMVSLVNSADTGGSAEAVDSSVGIRLGDKETDPNQYDSWRGLWDQTSNAIGVDSLRDPPVYAAVQELPFEFLSETASVVFKGNWKTDYHPDDDDLLNDIIAFEVTVEPRVVPARGGG